MDFSTLLENDFFKDVVESGKEISEPFNSAALKDGIDYPPSASSSSLLPLTFPSNDDGSAPSTLADVASPTNDRTCRVITASDVNAMRVAGPKKRVLATSPEPQACTEYTGHISSQTPLPSDAPMEVQGESLEGVSAEIARAFLASSALAGQEQYMSHGPYTQSSENVGACVGTPVPSTHFEETVFSFIQEMQDRVNQMEVVKHNMQTLVNEWSVALEAHNEMLRNFQEFAMRNSQMPYASMPWMQCDATHSNLHLQQQQQQQQHQQQFPSSFPPDYTSLQRSGVLQSEDPQIAQHMHVLTGMHDGMAAEAVNWQQTHDWQLQQQQQTDGRTSSSSRCGDNNNNADSSQNVEFNPRAGLRGRNAGTGIQPSQRPLARYQRPGGITLRSQTVCAQLQSSLDSEPTFVPAPHTSTAKPSIRRVPAVAVDDREDTEHPTTTTTKQGAPRPGLRRPSVWVEDELDSASSPVDNSDVTIFAAVELKSGDVRKFSHTSFLEPGVSVIVEDEAGSASSSSCGIVVHCYELNPSNKRVIRSEFDSTRGKAGIDGTQMEWTGRKIIGVSSKPKGLSSHQTGSYPSRSAQGYDRSKH